MRECWFSFVAQSAANASRTRLQWANTGARTSCIYIDQTGTPLESLGVMELLTGDHHLAEGVAAIPAPGHTPGHLVVLIASGAEQLLLLADALFDPAQITEPHWNSAFEVDGAAARKTRRRLLDWAETEGMVVSASHFPGPAFGRLVREAGRRHWRPL